MPIMPQLEKAIIETDAKVIGLVFPIHDFKAPKIVEQFVERLANIESKYIFAVATYGFLPLKAMKKLAKTIQLLGGKLSAGFVVRMPHNGIGYRTESIRRQEGMFNDWKLKLEMINEYVASRKKGKLETKSVLLHLILSGLFVKAIGALFRIYRQVLFKGWNSLAFIPDAKCNGCGICKSVCPMDNITIIDGKPAWKDHCALCFACLQWCPKEAIQAGNVTVNKRRYHHPDVRISDIIKAKQGFGFVMR